MDSGRSGSGRDAGATARRPRSAERAAAAERAEQETDGAGRPARPGRRQGQSPSHRAGAPPARPPRARHWGARHWGPPASPPPGRPPRGCPPTASRPPGLGCPPSASRRTAILPMASLPMASLPMASLPMASRPRGCRPRGCGPGGTGPPASPPRPPNCRRAGTWTARKAGCGSASGSWNWPRTPTCRCWSGSGSGRSSPAAWTSSSWSGWPAGSAGWPPGCRSRTPAARPADEILRITLEMARELTARHARCYTEMLQPALAEAGIEILRWKELTDPEQAELPAAVPGPDLPGADPAGGRPVAPVPLHLQPVAQPGRDDRRPGHRGDAVRPGEGAAAAAPVPAGRRPAGSSRWRTSSPRTWASCSSGMDVLEHHAFRITRIRDLEIDEDVTENLLQSLERELMRRRFEPAVRLEVEESMSADVLDQLVTRAGDGRPRGLPAARRRWTCPGCRPSPTWTGGS